jgi:CHAD domain-containing protein
MVSTLDMNAKPNLLMEFLDERWTKYRAELKYCQSEFSEKAVHDLRVATRRLLAVMDILRQVDPQPPLEKVRRTLKDQVDSLDDLRDTQVMLMEISKSLADFPDLQEFEKYLQARQKRLLRTIAKAIEAFQSSKLKKRVDEIRLSLEEYSQRTDWTARLLSAADQAYARARQAFGQIEASEPASIHRFRVRFKKFRYMVEIVRPVLENYPATYFEQMHDYQSRMGGVQDAVVFLTALAGYDSPGNLAAVREAFEKQRADLIAKFMERKEEFLSFWRAAPDQNLPWEQRP